MQPLHHYSAIKEDIEPRFSVALESLARPRLAGHRSYHLRFSVKRIYQDLTRQLLANSYGLPKNGLAHLCAVLY